MASRSALVVAVAMLATLVVACSGEPENHVRDTAPCGRVVKLLAEADSDATEDDAAKMLGDLDGDLAEACSEILFDLCEGRTSRTFDKPLGWCERDIPSGS